MIRLCSKSSRPYSGRPAARAHRQRWGAVARNGCRAGAGVSRGRSTDSNEPGEGSTGRTHKLGRAELDGQTRPSVVLTWSNEAERLSYQAATVVAEKECCSNPQGPSGTAVRGPACTVVWEAGGAIPPPTRLGLWFIPSAQNNQRGNDEKHGKQRVIDAHSRPAVACKSEGKKRCKGERYHGAERGQQPPCRHRYAGGRE